MVKHDKHAKEYQQEPFFTEDIVEILIQLARENKPSLVIQYIVIRIFLVAYESSTSFKHNVIINFQEIST